MYHFPTLTFDENCFLKTNRCRNVGTRAVLAGVDQYRVRNGCAVWERTMAQRTIVTATSALFPPATLDLLFWKPGGNSVVVVRSVRIDSRMGRDNRTMGYQAAINQKSDLHQLFFYFFY